MSGQDGDPAAAERDSSALRLVLLAGFAALAALQWGSLLDSPPLAGLLGAAAVAVAVGWGLSRVRTASARSARLRGGQLAVGAFTAVAVVASLLLLGLPAGVLPPSGWDRLAAGVGTGLTRLGGSFDYPFAGESGWARLLIVAPIVPLLIAAAVLSFRPGRDPRRTPVAGLLVLIAAVAIPATARPIGAPVLLGSAILALAAAWLWGERVRTLPAVALLACFGAVAVPVSAGLAAEEPPLDYRGWTLPGAAEGASFDWSHGYGPIDWPRTGELLFRARSDKPAYWRAEVLDEFYADRWRRSGGGGVPVPGEPVGYAPGVARDSDWTQRARFDVVALDSDLVVSPGSALQVRGIGRTERAPDGTMHTGDERISAGTRYSLTAYAPDPRPPLLRAGSRRYPESLDPYTRVAVPDGADLESIVAPAHLSVPLWGHRRGRTGAERRLAGTAYSQVARLAERLTRGQRSAYDAAVAVASHLRTTYAYDELPPHHRLPLRAFLFQDRAGYCQHFSGAMALMLRLVGIPARVAAGFAPGTPTADGRGFEVTDLDAHSWVEVYFNEIGWVPFDPTPPAAPAAPELRGPAAFGLGVDSFDATGGDDGARRDARPTNAAPARGPNGGGGSPVAPLGLLAAASAIAFVVPLRSLRHRRLPEATAAEREVEELRRVLRSTGWSRGGSTLLSVEDRLRGARHTAAASYVQRFRRRLYERDRATRPTLSARRSARRELVAGAGLRARIRMLLLMPPGAPRRVRESDRDRDRRPRR